MKKDMKWIKEELKQLEEKAIINRDYERSINNETAATYFDSRKIAFKTVSNLLSHVEVQHTRTIEVPEFVDEWFKSNYPQSWWKKIAEWENEVSDEDRKVYDWYQNYNEDDFIIAWITENYTIVEEQKYQVIIKDGEHVRLYLSKSHDAVSIGTNDNYIEKCPEVTYLTEKEIKDYDERFWAFAVKVEELEE